MTADEKVMAAISSIEEYVGDGVPEEFEDFNFQENVGTVSFEGNAYCGRVKGTWNVNSGLEMSVEIDDYVFTDFFGGKPQIVTVKMKLEPSDLAYEIHRSIRILNDITPYMGEYDNFEKVESFEEFLKDRDMHMSLSDFES